MDGRNEQQERDLERAAETRRRLSAGLVAAAAIVVSAFVVVHLAFGGQDTSPVLQPVLALMMSLALVSGFRSLDGPVGGRTGRRGSRGASDAAAGLMLWLACFAAIWTTLFLSSISSEIAGRARTTVAVVAARPARNVASPATAIEATASPTRAAVVGQGAAGRDVR